MTEILGQFLQHWGSAKEYVSRPSGQALTRLSNVVLC